jgi:uncharacterized protein (DUF488 family)
VTTIASIGYEGVALADLIAALRDAGIATVVDVRQAPISRRPGFSKSALAAALADAGIDYVHLRALGTPKPGRDAARQGRLEEFHRIFADQLATPEAQAGLARTAEVARTGKACLLCYERDPRACHRTLVLEALAGRMEIEIEHLFAGPIPVP